MNKFHLFAYSNKQFDVKKSQIFDTRSVKQSKKSSFLLLLILRWWRNFLCFSFFLSLARFRLSLKKWILIMRGERVRRVRGRRNKLFVKYFSLFRCFKRKIAPPSFWLISLFHHHRSFLYICMVIFLSSKLILLFFLLSLLQKLYRYIFEFLCWFDEVWTHEANPLRSFNMKAKKLMRVW